MKFSKSAWMLILSSWNSLTGFKDKPTFHIRVLGFDTWFWLMTPISQTSFQLIQTFRSNIDDLSSRGFASHMVTWVVFLSPGSSHSSALNIAGILRVNQRISSLCSLLSPFFFSLLSPLSSPSSPSPPPLLLSLFSFYLSNKINLKEKTQHGVIPSLPLSLSLTLK